MKKIFVAAFLLLTHFTFAQMPAVKKGVYVTDFTHLLTNQQVDLLNQRSADIYKKTGYQLIIVVMDALPKGTNVNDATNYIDEKWKTSDADTTNRMIYIAGIKQHGHRLKAARGVKSSILFNQQRCSNILSAMKPLYDLKQYNEGLQLMTDSVSNVLNVDSKASSSSNYWGVAIGAIFIGVVIGAFAFINNRKKPVSA
jgi:uncharacterized membrane protein YgcG